MKVLIWFVSIFLASALNTMVGNMGAFGTMLVYGVAFFAARSLCRAWDKRDIGNSSAEGVVKARFCRTCGSELSAEDELCSKCGTSVVQRDYGMDSSTQCPKCHCALLSDSAYCQRCGTKIESEMTAHTNLIQNDVLPSGGDCAMPTIETEMPKTAEPDNQCNIIDSMGSTEASSVAGHVTQSIIPDSPPHNSPKRKKRYCKYCGGIIDAETKKCTSCGKQYFRVLKFARIFAICSAFVILLSLNIFQWTQLESANTELKQSSKKIATLNETVQKQKAQIQRLNTKIKKYKYN